MTDLPCPPPDPNPRPPRFAMPAGAVDAHAHLFGPATRYAYSPARGYTPPDAPLEAYETLHRVLGVARGVLTQPSVYGTDNSLILDVLRSHGRRLRAIAAVEAGVSDRELEEMNALGVRGIRVNLVDKGGEAIGFVPGDRAEDHALCGRDADHPCARRGAARSPGVGQRLAASDHQDPDAERRRAARSARRLGAGRRNAREDSRR